MTVSEPTIYIDFLCPWAYRGAMWVAEVEKAGRTRPQFRCFSRSQNHAAHEGHAKPPVWEHDSKAKGLPAFLAATAARAQSPELGDRFRLALQRARHEDHLAVDQPATHRTAAERAGLDVARWERGLNAAHSSTLAGEHAAAGRRGVLGVPTLAWPD